MGVEELYTPPPDHGGPVEAVVAEPPLTVNDPLYVTVTGEDEIDHRVGPCTWPSRGALLPAVGDVCAVEWTDADTPLVVQWWAADDWIDPPREASPTEGVTHAEFDAHVAQQEEMHGFPLLGPGEVPVWDGAGWGAMSPAAAAHGHVIADVAGLGAALAAKMDDGEAVGGVLSGNLPNPGFAVDMATQGELDAGLAGKQPLDGELTALAALVSAANKLPYFTGAGAAALADLTAYARTLLDDADASTALSTLGVSAFAKTILDDADAAAVRATISAQPLDAELTALAGIASVADRLPYFTGVGTAAATPLTAFMRTLLDDADAATALATLGAQPSDSDLTAIAALATTAFGRGLLTEASAATALATLGGQPSDADLTAIAALATTAFGRSLLTQADAAATRGTIGAASEATRNASGAGVVVHGAVAGTARPAGYASVIWLGSVDPTNSDDLLDIWIDTSNMGASYQPLDADLTAIAALATTAFGRSLLTQADASAAQTTLGLSAFIKTLVDDADALTARTTLGVNEPTVVVSPAALPAAPANNQEVIYVADAANGVEWRLRYRQAQAAWFYIGGPPLMVTIDTLETTASLAYVALTTAGPSITVPLAGDYDVRLEASIANNTANDGGRMSFDVGATAALDADGILHLGSANADALMSGTRRKTGLAAATALVSKYRALVGGTATFRFRRMLVTPVKVT